jgi:hypothetical protein
VRERVESSIKEAEAQATLAKREDRERLLKAEANNATSWAFVHGEADKSIRKVALLEVKANFQLLFDRAAHTIRCWENAER